MEALVIIAVILVAVLALGKKKTAAPPVCDSDQPAQYQVLAAQNSVMVHADPSAWFAPGNNVPITDGETFRGKLTFKHKGAASTVGINMQLNVDGLPEAAVSQWVDLPNELDWTEHTIETDDGVFSWYGKVNGSGWHIDGTMYLNERTDPYNHKNVWQDMVNNGFVTVGSAAALYQTLKAQDSVLVRTTS